MPQITLHKFVFSKSMLEKVPDCQRAVLVYAGHISNELNWLNKLTLILQQTGHEIAEKLPGRLSAAERAKMDGNATQALMHLRLVAGKLHEAVKFLERWCFSMPWFEVSCQEMAADGKVALEKIQQHIADVNGGRKSDLIRLVRNKFGFHYDDKAVKQSIRVPETVEDFTLYLCENFGNTLYVGSEFAVMSYLLEVANFADAKAGVEALMDETIELSNQLTTLFGQILAHLSLKYFGDDFAAMGHKEDIVLETVSMYELTLPFFTSILSTER